MIGAEPPAARAAFSPAIKPLGGGLLITGGAVDLAGQVKARHRLHLQRGRQLAGIHIIIFDGIAGPAHRGLFQPRNGRQKRQLDILGQGGRNPVGIDGVVVKSFRLKENLVDSRGRRSG